MNLEYIKCIITSTFVLVLDAQQPAVMMFIDQLKRRLAEGPSKTHSQRCGAKLC